MGHMQSKWHPKSLMNRLNQIVSTVFHLCISDPFQIIYGN